MNSNQTLMLCCLPYAFEIIYLCVFSLLKMICIAVALFQGFQSLEKFRAGAPSTVHSERPLHGLSHFDHNLSFYVIYSRKLTMHFWPTSIFGIIRYFL